MSATTEEFDTTISSPQGDFWQFGVAPLAKSASYNLFTVNPGQTRTLTLTIRPSGKAGTVVRGVLYVDDFVDSLQFLSAANWSRSPTSTRSANANAAVSYANDPNGPVSYANDTNRRCQWRRR